MFHYIITTTLHRSLFVAINIAIYGHGLSLKNKQKQISVNV